MVLAPRRDRELFGRTFVRRTGRNRLHGTLSEMGMVVVSSTIAVGPIVQTLAADGAPTGEGGKALEWAFPRFADDLMWWVEAAKMQRQRKPPPYWSRVVAPANLCWMTRYLLFCLLRFTGASVRGRRGFVEKHGISRESRT